jgi:hypothetical protein
MPDQVAPLRLQQKNCEAGGSADFCAAGFDALVKKWDKCVSVGGGYVEK